MPSLQKVWLVEYKCDQYHSQHIFLDKGDVIESIYNTLSNPKIEDCTPGYIIAYSGGNIVIATQLFVLEDQVVL